MSSKIFLSVKGNKIVNREGQNVVLRGLGLGGWMNMENFITGYPGNEEAQRACLKNILGEEKYTLFFDKFLEYFFTEDDAEYIHSLGLNLLRLPVNYHHFEDDMEPFVIREEGFKHLDRVIDLCTKHGIYTIIDLHALPGGQNQDWHSDNPTHKALFWKYKHFQDRVINLWEVIARRYKDNPMVAGYNPINEPADPGEDRILPYYLKLYEAIRFIDKEHIIFLEGNRYSVDFHMFGEPLANVVYTNHDYSAAGFVDGGPYPGESRGEYVDKESLEKSFLERSRYMLEHNTPIWVGEFGPVYTGDSQADGMRYQLLTDQLSLYKKYDVSWAVWLYKDIGLQALTYVAADSKWIGRIGSFLEKKRRLGADAWGSTDTEISHVIQPLRKLFKKEFPGYDPFPFGSRWQINRLVRHILMTEPLLVEFGECFKDISTAEIDELMQSFLFSNCKKRGRLAEILDEFSG